MFQWQWFAVSRIQVILYTQQCVIALLQRRTVCLVLRRLPVVLLHVCLSTCFVNGRVHATPPTLLGSGDVIPGSGRAKPFLPSFTVIITASCPCNFLSFSPSLSFPANVHSTECHHNPPADREGKWLHTKQGFSSTSLTANYLYCGTSTLSTHTSSSDMFSSSSSLSSDSLSGSSLRSGLVRRYSSCLISRLPYP